MKTNRRQMIVGLIGLPLNAFPSPAVWAQERWPRHPVTIVVPFPAGGVADLAARAGASGLAARLGQAFVIENRAGAGGAVGHAGVARAASDGYTLMVTLSSLGVIPEANRLQGRPTTYEFEQFAPIARLAADPQLLVVGASTPWRDLQQFVEDVTKKPGQITYSTSGLLGAAHLPMEMFLRAADLRMLHVPYQGGSPAFNALLAGQVAVNPNLPSVVKGHLDAGTVRVLAQWGPERLVNFPDVPTMQQAGYTDVVNLLWSGVFAPRQTPDYITLTLREAIRDYMQNPATRAAFTAAGSQPAFLDGPEFATFLEQDLSRLLKVVREIKLR